MATTCQNCGFRNANSGYNCPACGQKVDDGSGLIIAIGIIAVLILIVGLIVGPAFLIYKAIKTQTNWWLVGGIIAAATAIYLSGHFEKNKSWSWLGSSAFYVNIIALCISLVIFFLRLKNQNYQLTNLFKSTDK